ncbi:20 kDa chaperonin [Cardamine amara subsp. amara]|uniref:20 kDa chaperonin n=1 Tax=Cardamine amara subsp. amara TaxID=228776 RepID=A0ABD0ZES8_CARAN
MSKFLSHTTRGEHEFQNQFLSGYSGTEVEFNDVKHLILKEDDSVGILETEDIKDIKPLNDRVFIKVAEAEEK